MFKSFLDRVAPGESAELRHLIQSTLVVTLIAAANIFVVAGSFYFLGRELASMIGAVSGSLFLLNIGSYWMIKSWKVFHSVLIFLSILVEVLLHIALGGYVNSNGVLFWGILSMVWAVMLEDTWLKYFWLGLFVVLALGLAFLEPTVATLAEPFPPRVRVFFLTNMLLLLIIPIFFLFDTYQKKLKKEKERSESLLLNILPSETAEELKETGEIHPKGYDSATVLFTDFKGFTGISENMEPEALVKELHYCFKNFDAITERFGLEKIKTIGDAYMCAGGLPHSNTSHPFDVVLAGLAMRDFIDGWKAEKLARGEAAWDIRIGVHTGKIVAGVVGIKKFAYDVWGDTVNTASRMESSGAPGKVNISAATYNEVKFLFDCEHRGKVQAKNKGEIDMYFVSGFKPGYSTDGAGREPNSEFFGIYKKLKNNARLVGKRAVLRTAAG